MSAKGDYIIEEVLHLTSYGLDPDYIATVLGTTPSTLSKFLYRRGYRELSNLFARGRKSA